MAWSGDSERRKLLPSNWGQIGQTGSIVDQIFIRDGGRCKFRLPSGRRCPRSYPNHKVEVDHKGDRENHELSNLRLLCEHHHKQVTQAQAWEGKWGRRKKFKRPEERHPGR